MDRFIKIHSENNSPKKMLHPGSCEKLRKLIDENKNVFVSGPSGVGKTTMVKSVLGGTKHLELDTHNARFYYFCDHGVSHIYIDNYEDDNSFKKIIAEVSNGEKRTKGAFIVETQKFYMFPNFENITLSKPSVGELMSLVDNDESYLENAYKCDGNVRDFMTYGNSEFTKDKFFTSKEYVADILSTLNQIKVKDTLQEHGSFWDTIHENYLKSEGVNYVKIINALSLADAHDCMIYDGVWDSMKYFVNEVIGFTKFYLGAPIAKEDISPGGCWSKHGNQKMRRRKIKEILEKGSRTMHKDHLHLLNLYAKERNIDMLKSYNISPQDYDIVNHLCIQNKLKQNDVNKIKKCLKK